jgi:hypothetical protein
MKNLNRNQLCSVELSLTGKDPIIDDVFQIAILPLLPNFEINKNKPIFYLNIEAVNCRDRCGALTLAVHKEKVFSLFKKWFAALGLRDDKRLMPISYDWDVKIQFLKTIFWEAYYDYFSDVVRDITRASVVLDDAHYYSNGDYEYQKYYFSFVATRSGHTCHSSEDILTRASRIPKIYKQLIIDTADLL